MPAVAFDSVGTGAHAVHGLTTNWVHTIGTNATALLVGVGTNGLANNSFWTRTVTVGNAFVPMTSLGVVNADGANNGGWVELFGLMHPPTGTQTVIYTLTNNFNQVADIGGACSVAYVNVASIGTAITNFGSSAALSTGAITSVVGHLVVGVLGAPLNSAVASPSGTQRFNSGAPVISNNGVMIEDAPGASSVTLTGIGTSGNWGAVGVDLVAVPGNNWTANSALVITAGPTADTLLHTSHSQADASLVVGVTFTTGTQVLLSPQQQLTLQNLGPPPASAGDVASQTFIDSLLSTNLTQDQINALIVSGFASYATTTYLANAIAGTAGPNTSPLATPTYVDTGNAAKILLTKINAPSGVVGLRAGGLANPTQFNVASTQRWPQADFSPSSYGSLTSASTETNIYSMTVNPTLTGNYRVFVTGTAQCSIATDTQIPKIVVRQGGTGLNGQIVAVGNGTAESYQASVPGGPSGFSYSATTAGTQPIVTPYTLLSGWNPGAGTTMSGNYIQIGATATATMAASVSCGSGTNGFNRTIQIVSSTNVVVATSNSVTFGAGTCTIGPTSFAVTSGQSYGVQGQYSAGSPGDTWSAGGTFTITSNTATQLNLGQVSILPSSLDGQTPITGSTTLYVNVVSSGAGAATINTVDPKLCVVALPA